MQNKTPQIDIGYFNHPKTSKLLNVIDYAVNSFCSNLGFYKSFFSKFLPYTESQFPKYMNPKESSHNLKITDFELIMENLDIQNKKMILDSLCHQFGFVCVDSAEMMEKGIYQNMETLLLTISATNGDLANCFLNAVQDGNINDLEKDSLQKIAYDLRAFLVLFESRIKETN